MKLRLVTSSGGIDSTTKVVGIYSTIEKADAAAEQEMKRMGGNWTVRHRASPPFGGPHDATAARWECDFEWVAWEALVLDSEAR